ncbi:4-hydroxy-tetrahydrodipicolinate synthase [Clostridiales bacterium CHKCI006]|nr:4-hydroxy-tetrahydrodipicolinate synthase [Clostridiales bacterium CHKCI006]
MLFKGLAPAVIAPMKADGSLDLDAFDRLIHFLVDNGSQALVINGTTGESPTLTAEEKVTLIEHAVKIANHRVPIIAGTGTNNTAASIKASQEAKAAGADGLLLVTPYYNKASQKSLKAHFEAIVNAVELPAILYNVPGRTGMTIAVDTLVELAKHPYIVGIKDATGNTAYTMEVLAKTQDLDFVVYSGEDGLILPMLASGVMGVISVIGNVFPKATQHLCELIFNQQLEEARKVAYDLAKMNQLLFADVNPIPVKACMAHLGYGDNVLRLPLMKADQALEEKLYACMDELVKKGY